MKTIELTDKEYKALVAECESPFYLGFGGDKLTKEETKALLSKLKPKRRRIIFEETGKPPEIGEYYEYKNAERICKRSGDNDKDYFDVIGLTRREEEFLVL